MSTKHNVCPDENGRCAYGADEDCPELINERTVKAAERYEYLRDHWEEWSGNTWKPPIGPKLDAAIDEAIEASYKK